MLGGVGIGGALNAGGNATIFSEGSVTAWPLASAGKDLSVVGHGNVSGNFAAGRDISAVAYGSVAGSSVTAGRDVGYASSSAGAMAGVWAGGDITASVSAGRNVGAGGGYGGGNVYVGGGSYSGSVFAFGKYDGVISAGNVVSSVSAVGPVIGSISAGTAIGSVRSGDDVVASLSAPAVGTVTEFDANLAAATPPSPPAARAPQLAADAAAAVAEVLTTRADVAAEYVTLRADIDASVADLAAQIADTIAETNTAIAEAQTAASDALAEDIAQAEATLAEAMAAADPDEFRQAVTQAGTQLEHALSNASDKADEGSQRAVEARDEALEQLAEADTRAAEAELRVRVASGGDRSTRDYHWYLHEQNQSNTLIPNIDPSVLPFYGYLESADPTGMLGQTFDTLNGGIDEVNRLYTVWNQAEEDGIISQIYQITGTGFYDLVGGTNGFRAITGEDYVTLRQYSDAERALEAGIGVIKFAGTAAGGAGALHGARSWIGQADNAIGRMDPRNIRFTQDTVSPNFRDQHTINGLIADLRRGNVSADDIPTIRVVDYEGKLWSLDNRRLTAFKAADVDDIPINRVSLDDIAIADEFDAKFRPLRDGTVNVVVPKKGREAARRLLREFGIYGTD